MHRWAGAAAFILLGAIFLQLCHTYPRYSLLMRTGNGMSYLGLDLVQQSANSQFPGRDIAHGNAFLYCSRAVPVNNARQAARAALQSVPGFAVVPPLPAREQRLGGWGLRSANFSEEGPPLVAAGSSRYCGGLRSAGCEPLTCSEQKRFVLFQDAEEEGGYKSSFSEAQRIKLWVCSRLDNLLLL